MSKPVLCLDFDGVILSQKEGFKGFFDFSGEPVPGALAFLKEATNHFEVNIYSARSAIPGGITAMRRWLDHLNGLSCYDEFASKDWIHEIVWPTTKPAAFVSIDDRAITFSGVFPDMNMLLSFQTWENGKFKACGGKEGCTDPCCIDPSAISSLPEKNEKDKRITWQLKCLTEAFEDMSEDDADWAAKMDTAYYKQGFLTDKQLAIVDRLYKKYS